VILGTAVIDGDFRSQLLRTPASVLPRFDLTREERRALSAIRADTIEQFAEQLYQWMSTNGEKGRGNGHGRGGSAKAYYPLFEHAC
jgi:hypothetical protein